MTIAALIHRGGLARIATATSATVATQAGERAESVARVATVAVANSPTLETATAQRWQVRFPGGDPMEVLFTPVATRTEVAAIYPGAMIEPLPEPPRRTATQAEANELRELIAVILADADDAERADVLRVALADADAALTSFRLLAADAIDRKRHEARFGDA